MSSMEDPLAEMDEWVPPADIKKQDPAMPANKSAIEVQPYEPNVGSVPEVMNANDPNPKIHQGSLILKEKKSVPDIDKPMPALMDASNSEDNFDLPTSPNPK
jgi:hypothetical protein